MKAQGMDLAFSAKAGNFLYSGNVKGSASAD
jgi:hypothetical protein